MAAKDYLNDSYPHALHSILFVDAYDSFANNIVDLLESTLENVHVVKITIDDHDLFSAPHFLANFDAVVVGPGPGNPQNPKDVGLSSKLWYLDDIDVLPVLGVCLGFQSLACAFGARMRQLRHPQHGIVLERLHHTGRSIFDGVGFVTVTKYHSLAIIGPHGSNDRPCLPETLDLLAWEDSKGNGIVPMAIKHVSKPFYGVQYHPESICSNAAATKVIRNWWQETMSWNSRYRRAVRVAHSTWKTNGLLPRNALSPNSVDTTSNKPVNSVQQRKIEFVGRSSTADLCEHLRLGAGNFVLFESATCRTAEADGDVHQVRSDDKSRYSIIGLLVPQQTLILRYKNGDTWLDILPFRGAYDVVPTPGSTQSLRIPLSTKENPPDDSRFSGEVWKYVSSFMSAREASDGDLNSPFWGGLMGYLSYEFGVASLEVETRENRIPDVCFAYVERSIVIDHWEHCAWVQSLLKNDDPWISETVAALGVFHRNTTGKTSQIVRNLSNNGRRVSASVMEDLGHDNLERIFHKQHASGNTRPFNESRPQIQKQLYTQKVIKCQNEIAKGESYELCLTNQAYVRIPRAAQSPALSDWLLYRRVCRHNPAPFAAFFTLDPVTVISSSPERFLSWDRKGKCDMRPIKGTVSKRTTASIKVAAKILSSEKERAENLMIVDLIRHDLHGICGAGRVKVKRLMDVEEFATVFQLVTTVEGWLPSYGPLSTNDEELPSSSSTGIDVLAACFPPGSMTGAPKKRSCSLLHEIENEPRGIYSGVMGYVCVGGAGDFSVVIRTAVRSHKGDVERPDASPPEDVWRVGAGGAITILSDPVSEYEEMQTKLDAIMRGLV